LTRIPNFDPPHLIFMTDPNFPDHSHLYPKIFLCWFAPNPLKIGAPVLLEFRGIPGAPCLLNCQVSSDGHRATTVLFFSIVTLCLAGFSRAGGRPSEYLLVRGLAVRPSDALKSSRSFFPPFFPSKRRIFGAHIMFFFCAPLYHFVGNPSRRALFFFVCRTFFFDFLSFFRIPGS